MGERSTETGGRDIDDLVIEYVDRLNNGERIDPEDILLAHPQHGARILEEIRVYLDLGLDDEQESVLPLGTLGDYTLQRQIGRGGMGVVYEAWENSMDRAVALKVLPSVIAADSRATTRFLREAQTAGKLNHPNVVGVYSTGVKEGTPWYAMEFVDGETLAQILAKIKDAEPETDTPFGKKDDVAYFGNLARAFADAADGLQHAHSNGVTHRDIKPSNLILDQGGRLRILDFGLARLEGQESLTLSGDFVGTPLYMSPEQARRKKIPIDHRTDIYSLGATMYEALCGWPPFRGRDHADTLSQIIERDPVQPRKANPRVPKDLETIVQKCLRKDSADRYGTAEALAQDLRRFVRGDTVEARPQSGWARARQTLRRRRRLLASAVLLLLLLGTGTLFWWQGKRLRRERVRSEYLTEIGSIAATLSAFQFLLDSSPSSHAGGIRLPFGFSSPQFESQLRTLTRTSRLWAVVRRLEQFADDLPEERHLFYHLARAHRLLCDDRAAELAARKALSSDDSFTPAAVLLRELESPHSDARVAAGERSGDWRSHWVEARRALRSRIPGREWPEARSCRDAYGSLIELAERDGEPYEGLRLEAYLGRGVAHIELGATRDAVLDLAVASFIAPGSIEPTLLLAKAHIEAGETERAETVLRRLLEESVEDRRDEVSLWVTMLHVGVKNWQAAFRWAGEIASHRVRSRVAGFLHWRLGNWREAQAAARDATAATPDDANAWWLRAAVLLDYLGRQRQLEDSDLLVELASVALTLSRHPEVADSEGIVGMALAAFRRAPAVLLQADSVRRVREALRGASAPFGAELAAGGEICDEFTAFSDPSDADPLTWRVRSVDACCRGVVVPEEEGIRLLRAANAPFPTLLSTDEHFSGDVRVRMSVTLERRPWHAVIYLHAAPGYNGYWGSLEWGGKDLEVGHLDHGETMFEERVAVDFEPRGDLVLELTRVGDWLEFRAWPASGSRPEVPQIRKHDATRHAGGLALQCEGGLVTSVCVEEL